MKHFVTMASVFLTLMTLLALMPVAAFADDYVGGQPVTTVQTGTVSGDVWYDISPAPDWGLQNVSKTFTLPAEAVAEPGRIQWARLYVSAYCGHMQNDYNFTITNRWDGDGDGIYEMTWPETGHAMFHYVVPQDDNIAGNDNTAFGGGANDPYKMINDHETRVTSDYLMWYDVTNLILGQTVNVNVDTTGSYDGRIKVISLVVAYNDGDSDQVQYWINQGHDVCSYYTEDNFGTVAIGTTSFNTNGISPFTSATLAIDYMASNIGNFGFPTSSNNFDAYAKTGTFTDQGLDRVDEVQGPYSGVKTWDVTGRINGTSDTTLAYARYLPATGTAAFFKLPLAILKIQHTAAATPPVASFTTNTTSGMAPLTVQFTDQSTNATAWAWDFNNDGVVDSTEQNPIYIFNTVGYYTVNFTATGPGGSDSEIKADYINVTAVPPVAEFTSNVTTGNSPLVVQFIDQSTGTITGYAWDFNNDGVVDSVVQNPAYKYITPGIYTVNLTVTGPAETNSMVKIDYITVNTPPITANFTATPTTGVIPLQVQFNDTSSNAPTSWLWNFGDGTTSTEQNPIHNYTTAGKYDVTLTVANTIGNDTLVQAGIIQAYTSGNQLADTPWPKIHAYSNNTGLSPYVGSPTNTTIWTYSTGGSIEYASPVIGAYGTIYIGNNNGVLYAINPDGTVQWAYNSGGQYKFNTPAIAVDGTIYIGNTNGELYAINPDGTLKWTYTIGANSYGSPAIATDGTIYIECYNKKLYAINPDGTLKWTYSTSLAGEYCYPAIGADGTIYIGNDIYLDAVNPDGTKQWQFIAKGGRVYGSPAIGADGTIYIGTYQGKRIYAVYANGTEKWRCAIGSSDYIQGSSPAIAADGTIYIGTTSGKLYAFNPDGTIKWYYTAGGAIYSSPAVGADGTVYFGCSDKSFYAINPDGTLKWKYMTGGDISSSPAIGADGTVYIGSKNGNLYAFNAVTAPVADFSASPLSGNAPLTVAFTDNSAGATGWAWDFDNDGIVDSTVRDPVYTYGVPGNYTVKLTASNIVGSDVEVKGDYITVSVLLPLVAMFDAAPTSGTAPLIVQFTDQSVNLPTGWAWDFDNDGVVDSTLQNPEYNYSVAGVYTVNLTVSNAGGSDCLVKTGLINVSVPVLPVADFIASPSSGTVPLTVQFTDRSANDPRTWAWDFDNDGSVDSTLQNPSYDYVIAGNYTVKLVVSNGAGSDDEVKTDYIVVSVVTDVPVVDFTSNVTSGVRPLTVQFTDLSTNSPTAWVWEYKNDAMNWTEFSTVKNPLFVFPALGAYDVRLTATNVIGSGNVTHTGYITVLPQCDLTISGMVNPVPASAVFTMEPNPVSITNVKNNGPDTVTNITVALYVSDVFNGSVAVNSTVVESLASGATTTVSLTDPTIRPSTANTLYGSSDVTTVTYTARVDPDNTIPETDETNNDKASASKPVYYNGYKGKTYEYNGNNTTTKHTYDLYGDIVYYTQPDSAYRGVGWNERTETWTSDNLPVPETASVVQAWLYIDYNWDTTSGGQPDWTTTFNGVSIPVTPGTPYWDQSNFGAYASYKYGLYVVDVTGLFNRTENTLVMTPNSGNSQALYPSTLAVIYQDPSESRKQIFINEECDELLLSETTFGTNLSEATSYVPFSGMIIDTGNMTGATLHSFAGSAGPGEGNLLFNGLSVANDAWQGNADTASAQVFNVTGYITADDNVAAIQGTTSGGMDTLQQFLVVEYKLEPTPTPTPTPTVTPTATPSPSPSVPQVSFDPSSSSVPIGDVRVVDVVVDSLPGGLSGYVLNVSLSNGSVGEIVGVSYPGWAVLNSTGGTPGDVVKVSAVDIDKLVQPGATNVTLATLTVSGDEPGITGFQLSGLKMDDDNGVAITNATVSGTMSVYTTLVVDFTANATSGIVGPQAPFVVAFADNSTGAPAPSSWLWSFGDNNTSIEQNPTYAYTAPGKYTVSLTAANAYLNDTKTRADYIVLTPYVEAFPGHAGLPTDPDGDYIFEDVNGNGRLDFDDIVTYFQNMAWIEGNSNVGILPYDLNGNGRVDYDDLVLLYHELLGNI